MKILIIGGAGYIGSHCVRQLLAAGHIPIIVDSFCYGHRDAIPTEVKTYQGDMGNREFMDGILTNEAIDIVMHFAAFAYVGESVADPLKYYNNNVAKTIRLLEAMQATGVNKFIFSSSCTVYGEPDRVPINEK